MEEQQPYTHKERKMSVKTQDTRRTNASEWYTLRSYSGNGKEEKQEKKKKIYLRRYIYCV